MSIRKKLLNDIESPSTSWETKLKAADQIVQEFGSDDVAFSKLLDLLTNHNQYSRNAAALALREIRDSRAVASLFQAIQNPRNQSDRSTMVYALETLDCKDYFLDVISLVLSSKADVQMSATTILFEQGFLVDDDDIAVAIQQIECAPLDDGFRKALLQRLTEF